MPRRTNLYLPLVSSCQTVKTCQSSSQPKPQGPVAIPWSSDRSADAAGPSGILPVSFSKPSAPLKPPLLDVIRGAVGTGLCSCGRDFSATTFGKVPPAPLRQEALYELILAATQIVGVWSQPIRRIRSWTKPSLDGITTHPDGVTLPQRSSGYTLQKGTKGCPVSCVTAKLSLVQH